MKSSRESSNGRLKNALEDSYYNACQDDDDQGKTHHGQ